MRRIECIFGKRVGGDKRRLRLLIKTSGGCYFQDEADIVMLCDAAFGEIDFAVSCPCVKEIVCDPSFRTDEVYYQSGRLIVGNMCFVERPRFPAPPRGSFDRAAAERALRTQGKGMFADRFVRRRADDAMSRMMNVRLDEMLNLIGQGKYENAAACIPGLIGAGRGLTPDADDFIVGILYAVREAGQTEKFAPIFRAVASSTEATTQISAEFLRCAVRGGAFSPVTDVLRGIRADAAFRLVRTGHSSGSSMLAGILAAESWINEREFADTTGKL